jgi:hypothetical protein
VDDVTRAVHALNVPIETPAHVSALHTLGFAVRRAPKVVGKRSKVQVEEIEAGDIYLPFGAVCTGETTPGDSDRARWVHFTDGTRVAASIGYEIKIVRRADLVSITPR